MQQDAQVTVKKEKQKECLVTSNYSIIITSVLVSWSRPTTLDFLSPFHIHSWKLSPLFLRYPEKNNQFLVIAWPCKQGELWCCGAVWLGRLEQLTQASVNTKSSVRWWKPAIICLDLVPISSFQAETVYPLLAQPSTFFGEVSLFRWKLTYLEASRLEPRGFLRQWSFDVIDRCQQTFVQTQRLFNRKCEPGWELNLGARLLFSSFSYGPEDA